MEKTARRIQKITALLTGLVAAYAITGGSLLLLALLLFKLDLTEGKITAGIIIIYILSCFLGGIAGREAGGQPQISVGTAAGADLCTASHGGVRVYRTRHFFGSTVCNHILYHVHGRRNDGWNVGVKKTLSKSAGLCYNGL